MISEKERLERWRAILGKASEESCGKLEGAKLGRDQALEALYDSDRKAGLGSSSPVVHRWLGDIREFFPSSVVRVLQRDAVARLGIEKLLLEKEMLEAVEPDVHLVATLLSLKGAIPSKAKATARQVVRKVVDQLEERLRNPMIQAIRGSLQRSSRTRRPRLAEIDWDRTIRKNLRHYLPERKTIIPEQLVGYGHRRSGLRDVILCVDQSGSMAASVVYSGIFAAVLASIPALKTRMVVFDTAVVDLTEEIDDPVDLLFGTQLGGGTDINQAVAYCQGRVTRPNQTTLVLITDLFEGGNADELVRRIHTLVGDGVQVICLLALSDEGSPSYDSGLAAKLAEVGVVSFACTPDLFPDLMGAALSRQSISQWAAAHGIVTAAPVA